MKHQTLLKITFIMSVFVISSVIAMDLQEERKGLQKVRIGRSNDNFGDTGKVNDTDIHYLGKDETYHESLHRNYGVLINKNLEQQSRSPDYSPDNLSPLTNEREKQGNSKPTS